MWDRGVRSWFPAALILAVALSAGARAGDNLPGAETIRFRNSGG